MIFITIGTANKGFDRLIKACDDIAQAHNIDFFAQIGSSTYLPKHFAYTRWLEADEINEKYCDANAFIIHGGFGTLSEVLRKNKPIIVIPRTFENGEAVNDQGDISKKLDSLGYVKSITNLGDLEDAILNLQHLKLQPYNLKTDIPEILSKHVELIRASLKRN